MKPYELTYIITPEITAEEAEAIAKDIEVFIQSKDAIISKSVIPSAKPLSYRIKKQGSGFFAVLEFQSEPEKIIDIKESLEKNSKILRNFIIIKNPAKERRVRGGKIKIMARAEEKTADKESKEEIIKATTEKAEKKVELKDIEQKLDEILGE